METSRLYLLVKNFKTYPQHSVNICAWLLTDSSGIVDGSEIFFVPIVEKKKSTQKACVEIAMVECCGMGLRSQSLNASKRNLQKSL